MSYRNTRVTKLDSQEYKGWYITDTNNNPVSGPYTSREAARVAKRQSLNTAQAA